MLYFKYKTIYGSRINIKKSTFLLVTLFCYSSLLGGKRKEGEPLNECRQIFSVNPYCAQAISKADQARLAEASWAKEN